MNEMKRRGRPLRAETDIEDERARVAAIAGTLFQHEGVEAISMRRLAKEAGVTPKTLYAYFADKRDILQHVWAKFFVELFDQIDQIATSNKGPRARLRAACLHYLAYWIDQPERYRMVFMSGGVSQSDVSIFLDASPIIERYAVFGALMDALAEPWEPTQATANLNALICALNGIAHNKITISNYDWGKSEALLDTLLPGIIGS